jgi:hypothetical protein
LVIAPIAVRTLKDNSAFLQKPFEGHLDLEVPGLHLPNADSKVLKVYEYGDKWFLGHGVSLFFLCNAGFVLALCT